MAAGLILDRDGVINRDTGYLHRIEDCVFIDGIFDLCRRFQDAGFRLIIATNQSGIGRGMFGESEFQALMTWMLDQFAAQGITIDRVYHAPDHPTEGLGRYRRDSDWRKPGPGMLRQAIQDFALDPASCWAIGDRLSDMAAASAAGIGHRILFDPDGRYTDPGAGITVIRSLADPHPNPPHKGEGD
jgi:D-glycero-D-manno-heptose 1,7-bisphosphate phosphatase